MSNIGLIEFIETALARAPEARQIAATKTGTMRAYAEGLADGMEQSLLQVAAFINGGSPSGRHYEQVGNRREYVGHVVDGILTYWLNGTQDEAMREWWTTPEASDAALELAHAMFQAIEERGMVIASPREGCSTCA